LSNLFEPHASLQLLLILSVWALDRVVVAKIFMAILPGRGGGGPGGRLGRRSPSDANLCNSKPL